jgi:hypothetical protein
MNIQFHAHGFDHTYLAFPSINKSLTPFKFHPWINLKCCWTENLTSHQRSYFTFLHFFSDLKFNYIWLNLWI